MTAKPEPQPLALQRIVLQKPHRHSGREYPVGAALELAADKAAWLVSLGVARMAKE